MNKEKVNLNFRHCRFGKSKHLEYVEKLLIQKGFNVKTIGVEE